MPQQLGHRVSGRNHAQRVHQTVYFLSDIIKASRDVDVRSSPASMFDNIGASFDAPAKMEPLSKPFMKVLRGARLSRIWSMEERFYPLQAVGSKAAGVLNHKHKELGLPRSAVVDIKGDLLNPLYLCSHTIADKNAMLFYESLLRTAQQCGSSMTSPPVPPPTFSMSALSSDANAEVKSDQAEWAREWCTEATLLEEGKVGRKQYFTGDTINAALRATRDKWQPLGLATNLAGLKDAQLNYNKRHSLHITFKGKCELLAKARRQVFDAIEADPTKFGFPAGWRVPAKPLQDTTIAERGLGPQDPVIEGHLPGNVNPDHSTPLFK